MFGFKKKKQEQVLLATQNGKVVALEEVPDEAFAQKMLGDGVAIIPQSGEVYSPVSGKVVQVTDTLHAYGIQSDDGLDVLVHIGVNTVELKGEGFTAMVKEGDSVKAGDLLAKVDLALLKEKKYPLYTPVIITNIDDVTEISYNLGAATAAETIIATYKK